MNTSQKQIELIALDVDDLLTEYIQIHNKLYKFTLDKLWFKAIKYNDYVNKLDELLGRFNNCDQKIQSLAPPNSNLENVFASLLLSYCNALINTVTLLRGICRQFYLKSEGAIDYSWTDYTTLTKEYNMSINEYRKLGRDLNLAYEQFREHQTN